MVAQEHRQWEQAEDHFLEGLRIFTQYNDGHNGAVVLRSLARLWPERKEAGLIERVAAILNATSEETVAMFQKLIESSSEKPEE